MNRRQETGQGAGPLPPTSARIAALCRLYAWIDDASGKAALERASDHPVVRDACRMAPGHAALALAGGWLQAGHPDWATPFMATVETAPDTAALAPEWLAQIFLQMDRHDDATRLIAPLPDDPVRFPLRTALHALLRSGGQPAAAGSAVDAAALGVAQGEEEDAAAAMLSWAIARLHRMNGDRAAGYAGLRRAIHAAPWRLDWWFELSDALIRDGMGPSLGRFWLDLPAAFPASPRWLLRTAWACMLSNATMDRALACSRRAQILDPSNWRAFMAEAQILNEIAAVDHTTDQFHRFRAGRTRRPTGGSGDATCRATVAAHRALALHPSAAAWNDLGVIRFTAGALDSAADAFRMALDEDPRQRHATINHAMVLLCLGQTDNLARVLTETEFLAALPKSLELLRPMPADGSGLQGRPASWRTPADPQEWRRSVVFSQNWWREPEEER